MGFFHDLIERREFSLQKWEEWLDSGGGLSQSGIQVTQNSALTWPVVWGCVLVKSQDVAKVPLPTYRRLGKNGSEGREEAPGTSTWRLFKDAPNPYMSPYIFRQTMQMSLETTGNAYAVIERGPRGEAAYLWPRTTATIRAEVRDGALVYIYTPTTGKEIVYPANRIFHLKGMTRDGITGMSPLEVFSETIGLGLAYQSHAARTFANQAKPPFYAKFPADIGPAKAKEFADYYQKEYGGIANAGKTVVTYGGMELVSLGFSNKDAELIESKRLTNEDGYRIWRVAPTKVMDFLRATFANVTEVNIAHVVDTLMPIQTMWEEAIHQQIMTPEERANLYVEHDNYQLLKGTPTQLAEVETKYVQGGISAPDEVRRAHNWKPIPGGKGAKHYMQQQMVELGAPPPTAPAPQKSARKVVRDPKTRLIQGFEEVIYGEGIETS